MKNNPISRKTNIVVQEFENEVLIYDLKINKAFCLNQTSAMIWELCDGKHSIAEIAKLLNQKLNQPITEDLVWLALDQFKRDGLLEDEQFEINFNGLNRRQAIKKVGFASMVMLPVIASVVAPSAVMAQSNPTNLPLNSLCSSPGQCTSGYCLQNTKCCAPGVLLNGPAFPPGSLSSCGPANACASQSAARCCSGTGSAGSQGVCNTPGEVECVCT